jgi:hypothetical protein
MRDTTAPTLRLPDPIVVDASGPSGAIVNFVVTASDPDDATGAPGCTPASGSLFAIGTTSVTCQSTDTHGNTGTGSFTVAVRGPSVSSLLSDLLALVTNVGPGNSLRAKVLSAQAAFAAGNSASCARSLQDLLSEVRAQTGKKISAQQAAAITTLTGRILAALGY